MSHTAQISNIALAGTTESERSTKWERFGVLYARFAVGSAFLSAVAGRFGLWHGTLDLHRFSKFLETDVSETLAFMPKATLPFLGVAATCCEITLGILLILGLWPRWVSLAAAVLLGIFATSMAISGGLKWAMDYSVYSASSAAVLLALHAFRAGDRNLSHSGMRKEYS